MSSEKDFKSKMGLPSLPKPWFQPVETLDRGPYYLNYFTTSGQGLFYSSGVQLLECGFNVSLGVEEIHSQSGEMFLQAD